MSQKSKLIIPTAADIETIGGGPKQEWYTWEGGTPDPVSDPPESGPMERTYFYDGFAIRTFFKREADGTIIQIWGDKSLDRYTCKVLEKHPNGRVASLETKSWIMFFDEEGVYRGAGNKLAVRRVRINDEQDQGTGRTGGTQKGPSEGSPSPGKAKAKEAEE
jgi:hypothetical protein